MKNGILLALAIALVFSQTASADPLDAIGGAPLISGEPSEPELPGLPTLPPVFSDPPLVGGEICLTSSICYTVKDLLSVPCYGYGFGFTTFIRQNPIYVRVGVSQAGGAGGYGGYC